MPIWKERDIITVRRMCSGCLPGEKYILLFPPFDDEDEDDYHDYTVLYAMAYNGSIRVSGCSCQSNWIKADPKEWDT